MSAAVNLVTGALEALASYTEQQGAVLGEAEAKTLATQVSIMGAGVEGLTAAISNLSP